MREIKVACPADSVYAVLKRAEEDLVINTEESLLRALKIYQSFFQYNKIKSTLFWLHFYYFVKNDGKLLDVYSQYMSIKKHGDRNAIHEKWLHCRTGLFHRKENRLENALVCFHFAFALDEIFSFHVSEIYYELGDIDMAIAFLDKPIEDYQKDYEKLAKKLMSCR